MKKFCLVVLFIYLCTLLLGEPKPLRYVAGTLIKETPLQKEIAEGKPIVREGATLTPRARLVVNARILHKKTYWGIDDDWADVSPFDIFVGWGKMSDQWNLDKLTIHQKDRFFDLEWNPPIPPISHQEIILNSTNLHIIPADNFVEEKLKDFRSGVLVRLSGLLVDVRKPGLGKWNTSLRRDDEGEGAGEIFFVEDVERLYLAVPY